MKKLIKTAKKSSENIEAFFKEIESQALTERGLLPITLLFESHIIGSEPPCI